MSIVGLDLAGVESRPTGLCVLRDMEAETSLVYNDEEVLNSIEKNNPKIVAVDAPLTLPPGRMSVEQRTEVHLRECDKELLRRGIKFFPITLGPMRKLTSRGMNLKRVLESKHFRVIEAYPGGARHPKDSQKATGTRETESGFRKGWSERIELSNERS